MRLRRFGTLISAALALQLSAGLSLAAAQEATFVGTHRDWYTFTFEEGGELACFMASKPTKEEGDYTVRGEVYLFVTHRPANASRDVVSVITGYSYQPDSEVDVTIGDQLYDLFTFEDTAWAPDEAADSSLVGAMKAGTTMIVKGRSSRGTLTTDTYSLLGFTAAYNEITRICGL